MKTLYKYQILLITISILITVTSCKKTFYTNANINPNSPSSVPPSVLLPTAEVGLAYSEGGNMSLYTSLIMQQTLGLGNQAQFYYDYNFKSSDMDELWQPMYTSAMENNYNLMQLADKNGFNEYSGISRLLMAYTLQTMVDCWGKIPYSTALQGTNNLEPTYDNDQALYATIDSLVAKGIALLNQPAGSLYPTVDDIMYGGLASDWIAFGHAINARVAIHQLKINPGLAPTALNEVNSALNGGTFANAEVYFGTSQTNGNPWYQFNTARAGYVSFATSTLATMLGTLNDPRFNIFIDTAGATDQLGAYYGSSGSPIEFITEEELYFIQAEATITSTGSVNQAAVNAYDTAIAVNMEKLGIPHSAIVTYIAANQITTSTSAATAIADNATQEWIALYLNPEAWVVWRRTNSPSITPPSQALYSSVPRRFIYPTTEMQLNAANLAAAYPGQTVTLFAPRIFWDN